MTRAPLPGKLPEYPDYNTHPDVFKSFDHWWNIVISSGPQCSVRELAEAAFKCGASSTPTAYWESRARLAVEALKAHDKGHYWVVATEALETIGPLPEEDRT